MARVFGYRVNKGVYLQRLNGEILIVRKSYANYMWQTVVPLIFFFFLSFFFFSFLSNVLISICSFLLLLFFLSPSFETICCSFGSTDVSRDDF